LKLDQVINSNYPATKEDANGGKGLSVCSGTTTCQYSVNNSVNPQTFCITETKSNKSYYINQDSLPAVGGCIGDVISGIPAIANPSFESDTVGNLSWPALWTHYGNDGNVYGGIANDFAGYGTKSLKFSQITTDMDGGMWTQVSGLKVGQSVTLSSWVKSSSTVANASLVLTTTQNGLLGSQTVANNQGPNVNGRFSATLSSIDQTAVNIFIGQGSFGYSSRGDVWFDGIVITIN